MNSNDCDLIASFYKDNKLSVNNGNCCKWPNIQCINNRIKSFQYIDDSNEKIDFSTFPILSELTDLIIQGKYLLGGSVPIVLFSQPKLNKLILDNSNIWEIPNDANSVSSSSLEILSLKNNLLTAFPYFLRNMPKLKSLNISDNKINESLTDEIKQFPSLEILNISSNFLTGRVPDMPSNLKELYVDSNQFSSLQISFSQSPDLELFSGGNNKFGENDFVLLTEFNNMKNISLENVGLSKIPGSISSLSQLKYLSLKNNDIEQLPEEFDSLKSLEELNLSGNSNLKGKIKSGVRISKCYLGHTDVCLENDSICSYYDSKNICGQSKSSSVFSTILIIFLCLAIIALIIYIIIYLIKFKKENDKLRDFSLMSKTTKGNSESFNSDNSELNYPSLRSRTSKEVINSINKAVSHLNPEGDTKIKNAEIAFSNGMKIVGSANEAFNLATNKNQKPQLREIFRDVDSFDGEITDHLSANLENDNNHITNTSNSFGDDNHYPSLNRSVISNPCGPSEHIIPNFTSYSLPRNNNVKNVMFADGSNPNVLTNNMVMNNGTSYTQNILNNNNITSTNNYFNKFNNVGNNNDNFNSISNNNTFEIQKRPRSRSSLANSTENINNNNMNILRLNARDTVMPGVRKDNANEISNKIININSEMSSQSQLYKNGILNNNVNNFNLEKFNNYSVINNNTGLNNGQIRVLSPTLANANNNVHTSPILVALPVLPVNTNSLNRNQNKLVNFNTANNNLIVRKETINNNLNPPQNNIYIKNNQENIPQLMVNSVYTNPVNPVNPKIPIHRNLSSSSNSNSFTDTNITNSSLSFNNSSFSEDELSKNILFQNPTSVTVHKNNSSIRKGYSNTLKPIFNHQDSLKSVGTKSASSGNVSSLDLHMDSIELDEIFNEINSASK